MPERLDLNSGHQPRESWHGLQSGTVLADRYRIERPISRGGMGAVYEAVQLGLDRAVAVKVLLPMFSSDTHMMERFRREARSAASLRHPNIIQIYDYGISEHGPYIVMELMHGQSLRQTLRGGPIAPEHTLRIIEQVCSAVASAHAAGIIHRDLKPDNIIIEEQAAGHLLVKVLDFGIAKLLETPEAISEAETQPNLTGANAIGSPHYMSPEQCMGIELDARSDVYALGVTLYEMLTGGVPFPNVSSVAVLMHQVGTQPMRLRERSPEISAAIESVVMRALAKDPQMRYATATELAQALRRAFDDPDAGDTHPSLELARAPGDPYLTNAVAPPFPSALLNPAQRTAPTGRLQSNHRLAILPLRNLMADPEIEYLGYALADALITQLCCLKSLIVRPSSSVERYRDRAVDPRVVGRELQVDTILSGSYIRAGENFRVNAQLIEVMRNEVLWQERIDLKFDNVIELQDRICEELIRGLRLNLSTGEQEALRQDGPSNPVAYELYLRALAAPQNADGHRHALELLEASVNLDPLYAPAWAALAGRYLNARHYLNDESLFVKADDAINQALGINPSQPAAIFSRILYHADRGDVRNALVECKHLLGVAPNSEYAYQAMGHAYDYAGLPDIALTLFRKAVEINPTTYPYIIGVMHYQKGDYPAARREFEKHLGECPEIYFWLGVLDLVEGNKEQAIAHFETSLAEAGASKMSAMTYAMLCAVRGEKEEGQRALSEILDSGAQLAGYSYYVLAPIYSLLGDFPNCFRMLREAVRTGYANYPFLMSDPLLAAARQAEGFAEVAAEMQKMQTQLQLMLVTE
ncbi:MAG TPA: protein kinase [Blastocatellia bacterium]|nr:protein kinase [Blastocatellia bacterium]